MLDIAEEVRTNLYATFSNGSVNMGTQILADNQKLFTYSMRILIPSWGPTKCDG